MQSRIIGGLHLEAGVDPSRIDVTGHVKMCEPGEAYLGFSFFPETSAFARGLRISRQACFRRAFVPTVEIVSWRRHSS
jgi:hypothetical protein